MLDKIIDIISTYQGIEKVNLNSNLVKSTIILIIRDMLIIKNILLCNCGGEINESNHYRKVYLFKKEMFVVSYLYNECLNKVVP